MADTTARLLHLLSLLQAHRSWSGAELIRRLEVSERTLRRDVERLRQLGYPVRATTGPAGGYELEAGAQLPPLVLDDEEAVAIAVGLRTAAGGSITGIEETSVRALAKLEQILPPRVRSRVNLVQSMVVPLIRSRTTVATELLTLLAQACRDHERIRFEYRSGDGRVTERNVEPHHLVALHQRWYLLSFDRDRQDWRTFRLDRLSEPFLTRARFQPRPIPGGDPAEFVMASMQSREMRFQASVTLAASAAAIEEKLWPGEGAVEPTGEHSCLFRTQGDSLEWLAARLMWLDVDFRIHGPPELIDYVAVLSTRLGRASGAATA